MEGEVSPVPKLEEIASSRAGPGEPPRKKRRRRKRKSLAPASGGATEGDGGIVDESSLRSVFVPIGEDFPEQEFQRVGSGPMDIAPAGGGPSGMLVGSKECLDSSMEESDSKRRSKGKRRKRGGKGCERELRGQMLSVPWAHGPWVQG